MSKKTVKKTPVKKVTPIKKPPVKAKPRNSKTGGQVQRHGTATTMAGPQPSPEQAEILRLRNDNVQLKNLMSTLKNTIVWQNVKMMEMENQA